LVVGYIFAFSTSSFANYEVAQDHAPFKVTLALAGEWSYSVVKFRDSKTFNPALMKDLLDHAHELDLRDPAVQSDLALVSTELQQAFASLSSKDMDTLTPVEQAKLVYLDTFFGNQLRESINGEAANYHTRNAEIAGFRLRKSEQGKRLLGMIRR